MNWKTIRLELAPTAQFPTGSVSRGYLIRAPLNDNGMIDEQSLNRAPERAKVRRFWSTEPDERGQVTRVDGHWALRCSGKSDRLLDLDARIRPRNQLTVLGAEGSLPFRVKILD